MAFIEQTIVWDERVGGFTSFQTYAPDTGFSVNNRHFTLGNGGAYEHNRADAARGRFYGDTQPAEVEIIFNDSPSSIKSFRTIGYEGDGSWSAEVTTDQESIVTDSTTIPITRTVSGNVSSDDFVNKEGKYFSYIRGENESFNNPDISSLLVTGLGVGTVSGTTITVAEIPTDTRSEYICDGTICPLGERHSGDRLYFYIEDEGVIDTSTLYYAGEILTINNNIITYGQAVEVGGIVIVDGRAHENQSQTRLYATYNTDFTKMNADGSRDWNTLPVEDGNGMVITYTGPTLYLVKNDYFFLSAKSEGAEVAGLKGFFAIIKMSVTQNDMSELFSVSSEVTQSSS